MVCGNILNLKSSRVGIILFDSPSRCYLGAQWLPKDGDDVYMLKSPSTLVSRYSTGFYVVT